MKSSWTLIILLRIKDWRKTQRRRTSLQKNVKIVNMKKKITKAENHPKIPVLKHTKISIFAKFKAWTNNYDF